ncbi:MAG: hypothetical protein ACOY3I_02775 [Verrucomicrobiota bacterium]
MIYSFNLSQVSIGLGILLGLFYGWGLWKFDACKEWLLHAHRNYKAGLVTFVAATAWTAWLLMIMDLMEYSPQRHLFVAVVIILAILVIRYLPDYLFVRALGVLLLLGANVLLDAAFLRDEPSKLVIVVVAYGMALKGMFLVGAPYLFRDGVAWMYQHTRRAKIMYSVGMGFAVLLLLLGVLIY